jgi:hypothetical protein
MARHKVWRRPPMPRLTASALVRGLDMSARDAARLAALDHPGKGGYVDAVLDEVNRVVGGHGVEAIRSSTRWDNSYYMDIVALYVNLGDPYVTTVVYDVERDRFYVTDYGEWVERRGEKLGVI